MKRSCLTTLALGKTKIVTKNGVVNGLGQRRNTCNYLDPIFSLIFRRVDVPICVSGVNGTFTIPRFQCHSLKVRIQTFRHPTAKNFPTVSAVPTSRYSRVS